MKDSKPLTFTLFIGLLLVVIFAVGLACSRDPAIFQKKYRYDFTLDQVCAFCADWWLPAGIIGFPMLLGSIIISLVRDRRK